jgi:DNA-binding transcriptional ArsR family regulator
VHAFDVLGDPVRRRLVELLADGEQPAGALASTIHDEFGISQPAVSQHLRVLRESGFTSVRRDGTRRLYAIEPTALDDVEGWLARIRRVWAPPLDALATEVARGKRARRRAAAEAADATGAAGTDGAARPPAGPDGRRPHDDSNDDQPRRHP